MNKPFSFKAFFASAAAIVLLSTPWAFSQDKPAQSPADGSIKLIYQYPADTPLKYRVEGKIVQDMDINGSSMLVNISTYTGCTIRSAGNQNGNLVLEIKIDSMAQNVDSPQGVYGGPVTEVKDKSFKAVIAPDGKIVDLSGAAEITITIPGSGESDASRTFTDFFPVLPDKAVKIGDTWVTHDTSNIKSETMSRWMPVESNCKFEGYEDLEVIRCAKISATLNGTMKITNQSQGMEVTSSGTFTGERSLYFAVDKGYYIREVVKSKMNGMVEIADQGMSFPVVMDITTTNELIR